MKKVLGLSMAALVTLAFASVEDDIARLEKEIAKLKKKVGKVNAQSANDFIKWSVDFRTAIDSVDYDMADGSNRSKNDLMSMRLWLNMAYSPDSHNVFKGQLSMNKAFGADFADFAEIEDFQDNRNFGMGSLFDWTANEALSDNTLKVRQAYWLYLGDNAFGVEDLPWTFSIGRRPSTNGFLINLRDDDPVQSPLGHIINVEFDGLSSKLDLSSVTGIDGFSVKICMGQGATNADPLFSTSTPYANSDDQLEDITLVGVIIEPYNDGQFITKFTWFRAYDLPDLQFDDQGNTHGYAAYGDLDGGAFSVMVDGLTEDGYLSDAKVFASYAWTVTHPDSGKAMLGSTESETGTSYWLGAQLPVTEDGKFGIEYNHGSQYWRPFTYAEDTMIGSKMAVRGDAWEAYFTWHINDALSAQIRYTKIDYDYTGSQGFFGDTTGMAMAISDLKAAAAGIKQKMASGYQPTPQEMQILGMEANTVESAQDIRFYIRYRF